MEVLNIFLTNLALKVLNPLIVLMFGLAVIYFLWGILQYIQNSQSESERKKGAQHILWSIVGMVIMMGVYSILQMVKTTVFN